MSLGIALTLPDGALLVADGRQIRPFVDGDPPRDNVDKIQRIHPRIYVIVFGITAATDYALRHLLSQANSCHLPEVFSQILDRSVSEGWAYLLSCLTADIDLHHQTMKTGLLAGGIVARQQFVAGCLCGSNVAPAGPLLRTSPLQFVSLGGEEQRAAELFRQTVEANLPSWKQTVGPMNDVVRALLRNAESTIRYVEQENPEVGGTIRYAVIRSGFPVEKDIWIG